MMITIFLLAMRMSLPNMLLPVLPKTIQVHIR
jgi:hypothetical protein